MRGLLRKAFRITIKIALLLVLLFILALLAMTISDYRPAEKDKLSVSGHTDLTLIKKREFAALTWNLGYFGLGGEMDFFYENGEQVRPGREPYFEYETTGLKFINDHDSLDFILLQEVDRNSKRSYRQDQFLKIADILTSHCSCFAVNYKVPFVPVPISQPMGKVMGGIAFFSKLYPAEVFRYSLPGKYPWPKGLFLLDRCFILLRYPLEDGRDLVFINTHNEAFDSGGMRDQQMRLLRQTMVEEYRKGNYVVAGGDWNINPSGYQEFTLKTGDRTRTIQPVIDPRFFPLGWSWVFDPYVPTNRDVSQVYKRGHTPTTIIDYFITSPNIQVMNIQTIDLEFKCSDHQPVIMKFRLSEQG
jgi:endonuclease/exonuclease/phosphatase family metal-dependent hydrolase